MSLEINLPDVIAEVSALFARYERALMANDVAALNDLFWVSEHTQRYGLHENLYGHAEIAAFRAARDARAVERRLIRPIITTYGRDFATANTQFERLQTGRLGRQTQTWARLPEIGWKIVAAHVSFFDPGD